MRWSVLVPPGAGRNYLGLPMAPTRFVASGTCLLAKAGSHLFKADLATLQWAVVARDAHDPWLVGAVSCEGSQVAYRRGNRLVVNGDVLPPIEARPGQTLLPQKLAVDAGGTLWVLGGGHLARVGADRQVRWVRPVPTGPLALHDDRVVVAARGTLHLVDRDGQVQHLPCPTPDAREVALRGSRVAVVGFHGLWLTDTERGLLGGSPDLMTHAGVAIDAEGCAVTLGGEVDGEGRVTTFRPPLRPGLGEATISPLVLHGEELRALWSEGSAVLRYRRDARQEVLGEEDRGAVTALAVATDGRVAVGWGVGRVEVYGPGGERLTAIEVDEVVALRFADDGRLLMAAPQPRLLSTTYATLARADVAVRGLDVGPGGQAVWWTDTEAAVVDLSSLSVHRRLAIDGGLLELHFEGDQLVGLARSGNVVVYDAATRGRPRRRPRLRVPMVVPWVGPRVRVRRRGKQLQVFDRVSYAVTDIDGRVLQRAPFQGWFTDRGEVMIRRDNHRTLLWRDGSSHPLAILQGQADQVEAVDGGRLVVASLHHGVLRAEHDPLEPPPNWHPELGEPDATVGRVVADGPVALPPGWSG